MRHSGKNGFTVVEVTIGVAVGMVVIFGAMTLMKRVSQNTGLLSRDFGKTMDISVIRNSIRTNYFFRTQIDLLSGTGQYTGIVYDTSTPSNAKEFWIRTRSKADLTKFGGVIYRTECRSRPPKWPKVNYNASVPNFCPLPATPQLTCDPNTQVPVIVISEYGDETDVAGSSGSPILIPNINGTPDVLAAAAFCIIRADNERVALNVVLGRRSGESGQQIRWFEDSMAFGEDMGQLGIEYLRK